MRRLTIIVIVLATGFTGRPVMAELNTGLRGLVQLHALVGTEGRQPFTAMPMASTDKNTQKGGPDGNLSNGINAFGEISLYRNTLYFEQDIGYYNYTGIIRQPGDRYVRNKAVTYTPNIYTIRQGEALSFTSSFKGKTPGYNRDFRYSAMVGLRLGSFIDYSEYKEYYIYENEKAEAADNEKFQRQTKPAGVAPEHSPVLMQLVFGLGLEYLLVRQKVNILLDARFGFDFSKNFFRPLSSSETSGALFEIVGGIQFGVSYRIWEFKN